MTEAVAGSLRMEVVRAVFSDWFGTSPATTDLLVALYRAGGKPMNWRTLAYVLNSHRPLSIGTLQVRICDLRKALDVEAVETGRGSRYALTDVGLFECRRALIQMSETLREAAEQAWETQGLGVASRFGDDLQALGVSGARR